MNRDVEEFVKAGHILEEKSNNIAKMGGMGKLPITSRVGIEWLIYGDLKKQKLHLLDYYLHFIGISLLEHRSDGICQV